MLATIIARNHLCSCSNYVDTVVLQDIVWKVKICLLRNIIDCTYRTHMVLSVRNANCSLRVFEDLLAILFFFSFFFLFFFTAISGHIWSWEHPALINFTDTTWRQQYLRISAEIRISFSESEAHTFMPHSGPYYLSVNPLKMLKDAQILSCAVLPISREVAHNRKWLLQMSTSTNVLKPHLKV